MSFPVHVQDSSLTMHAFPASGTAYHGLSFSHNIIWFIWLAATYSGKPEVQAMCTGNVSKPCKKKTEFYAGRQLYREPPNITGNSAAVAA